MIFPTTVPVGTSVPGKVENNRIMLLSWQKNRMKLWTLHPIDPRCKCNTVPDYPSWVPNLPRSPPSKMIISVPFFSSLFSFLSLSLSLFIDIWILFRVHRILKTDVVTLHWPRSDDLVQDLWAPITCHFFYFDTLNPTPPFFGSQRKRILGG